MFQKRCSRLVLLATEINYMKIYAAVTLGMVIPILRKQFQNLKDSLGFENLKEMLLDIGYTKKK